MICRKNYYVVSLKDMQIIGKLIKDQNNRWRANSFRKFTVFLHFLEQQGTQVQK